MQPDREDAERDDAAVEVAAHFFLRAFRAAVCCRRCAQDLVFARLAPPRALLPLWSSQDLVCSGI